MWRARVIKVSETNRRSNGPSTIGFDLPVVGILTFGVGLAVLLNYDSLSLVLTVLSPLLLVFLPGYATVAAVFPSNRSLVSADGESANDLDGLFRLALAFGVSVAVSGLLGIAMHMVGIPLTRWSVTITLSIVTFGGLVIAWVRRRRLATPERYAPRIGLRSRPVREKIASRPLSVWLLPIIVIVTVLVAVFTVAVAADSPHRAESATELAVLPPGESDTAGEFPHYLSVNESQPVDIGVGNHESDSIRITFSLYQGEPPEDTAPQSAYREVHFWANITGGADWQL